MSRDVEATFKLLLIGDSGVDFKVKTLVLDEKLYKLTIWVRKLNVKDTAGQERFRTLTSSYYRGAQGVILVYDVSNRASFEHLSTWFSELDTYAHPNVIKIVVGNKTDKDSLGGRQVTRSEGEELARKSGTLFIETSAKTTTGVRDAFEELVQKVNELTKIVETPRLWQVTSSGSGLDLSAQSPADGSCSC